MRSTSFLFQLIVVLTFLLNAGCGAVGVVITGGGGYPQPAPRQPERYESYHSLKIPKGHLPSPGACKIWYPGKPAGHQPSSGPCDTVMEEAPLNTWILHRPKNDPGILEVQEKRRRYNRVEIVISRYYID